MSWSIKSPQPVEIQAVYFLVLPDSNEVLHSNEVSGGYIDRHLGDFNSFKYNYDTNTPFIPVDMHTAMTFNWVQPYEMARNMPYLDEKIRAAVALVK